MRLSNETFSLHRLARRPDRPLGSSIWLGGTVRPRHGHEGLAFDSAATLAVYQERCTNVSKESLGGGTLRLGRTTFRRSAGDLGGHAAGGRPADWSDFRDILLEKNAAGYGGGGRPASSGHTSAAPAGAPSPHAGRGRNGGVLGPGGRRPFSVVNEPLGGDPALVILGIPLEPPLQYALACQT